MPHIHFHFLSLISVLANRMLCRLDAELINSAALTRTYNRHCTFSSLVSFQLLCRRGNNLCAPQFSNFVLITHSYFRIPWLLFSLFILIIMYYGEPNVQLPVARSVTDSHYVSRCSPNIHNKKKEIAEFAKKKISKVTVKLGWNW